jgi:hypothetical protein
MALEYNRPTVHHEGGRSFGRRRVIPAVIRGIAICYLSIISSAEKAVTIWFSYIESRSISFDNLLSLKHPFTQQGNRDARESGYPSAFIRRFDSYRA